MQDQKNTEKPEKTTPIEEVYDKTARSFDHEQVSPEEGTQPGADPTDRNFQRMDDESDVEESKGPEND
jgi:hypothetical protein